MFLLRYWLLLMIVLIVDVSNGEDESIRSYHDLHECPEQLSNGHCHCGYRSYQGPYSEYIGKSRLTYVTNCTDSAFNDTSVLWHVPSQTEVLIFTGNNFTNLHGNVLNKEQRYNKLLLVDLSRNQIESIHGKAFHSMKQVQTLILNDNNITIHSDSLHPHLFGSLKNLEELHLRNAFTKIDNQTETNDNMMSALYEIFRQSQLDNLKILNLEHNQIRSLTNDNFFCVFPQLRHLLLSNNYLKRFNLNMSCLNELTFVDISQNQIETVDNGSLSYLLSGTSGSYHVNISENPFHCDCHLIDFYKFIRNQTPDSMNGKIKAVHSYQQEKQTNPIFDWYEEFKCHGEWPPNIKGKYLDDIQLSDLICPPKTSINQDEISIVNIITGKEPESEKKAAIRRYNHYITFSYIILAILLSLLLFLVAVLLYTNREFIQSIWNMICSDFNSKLDYTALDKEVPTSSDNNWWLRLRNNRHKQSNTNKKHRNHPYNSSRRNIISSSNIAEDQL